MGSRKVFEVIIISNTRESVSPDIQTLRRGLNEWSTAEIF